MRAVNTAVTSREAILTVCREMVSRQGLSSLNMRSVARACQVALGSLYNYFPSKDDLLLATVESVWQDIFHMGGLPDQALSFPGCVQWIFDRVQQGRRTYPNFFTVHSLLFASSEKERARQAMGRHLAHIKTALEEALRRDPDLRPDAFSPAFSREEFLDFVLTSLLALLLQGKPDCSLLLELIRRAIYPA